MFLKRDWQAFLAFDGGMRCLMLNELRMMAMGES
jgi:hypothetical protein